MSGATTNREIPECFNPDKDAVKDLCSRPGLAPKCAPGENAARHVPASSIDLDATAEPAFLDHGIDFERCIHTLVEQSAESWPEAVAVECGGRKYSYRELNQQANRLARRLQSLGVGNGKPVGICTGRSWEMVVALLGVLKTGGACLPLDPKYPQERLLYMVEDARPISILCSETYCQIFERTNVKCVSLQQALPEIVQDSPDNLGLQMASGNLAYVIYTSGSTGKPRGVRLTHRGLVNHHLAARQLYGLSCGDRVLQFSSISFDIAIEEIFPTWIAGATLVLRPEEISLQIRDFMQFISAQRITVLDLPTAYWHEWVHELAETGAPLPAGLRLVIVGGEKASTPAYLIWRRACQGRIRWVNTYGPTETSVIATSYEPSADHFEIAPDTDLPIGKPIPGVRIHILDGHLKPALRGAIGEIYIGGPGVADGYLNRPDLTAEKFIRDPFSQDPNARLYKTGDMARFLEDGNIAFQGRQDDQVKIRGFRVELGEVESALNAHPELHEVVVVSREFSPGDKRLVAYVVPAHHCSPTPQSMREFLRAKLPDYMVPSVFVVLKNFPLTPNGKVDKRALPDPVGNGSEAHRPSGEGKGSLGVQITHIWEGVLGIRPIGVDDNFFELGGHSILAVRLMARLERSFGRVLPIDTLFQAPTIRQLAIILAQENWRPHWLSLVPIQPQGKNLPFFCVHGAGGTVLRFRHLSQFLGPDQPFYGLQARGLDGKQQPLRSVEEMAAAYLIEVRSVQPHGPYRLGGYSFGGLVAFEMARQLASAGEALDVVALLDTFRPGSQVSVLDQLRLASWWQRVVLVARKGFRFATSLRKRFATLWFPKHLKDVRSGCYAAEQCYKLQPFDGALTLFLPKEKSLRNLGDPSKQWLEWARGGVEVHEIDGDHGSITMQPQVRILGEQLRKCLSGRAVEQNQADRQTEVAIAD